MLPAPARPTSLALVAAGVDDRCSALLHRCGGRKIKLHSNFSRPGVRIIEVRIRLGSGIARFAPAPILRLELPDGATVEELYAHLSAGHPGLAPALRSALPVVGGEHVAREQALAHGDEVALLAPVAGG